MPFDTRLPMMAAQGAQVNLADIYRQQDERKAHEQQVQMQGRQMDMQEQRFDLEMQQHLASMDENKRKAAEKGLEDMAAAVQWADTPQKWQVVQQHLAQSGHPELASTPFEARENSLITLGKMGDYLKATAPKIQSIEAGGSLATVDPRTGEPTFTVVPNPGGMATGAPAAGGNLARPQSKAELDALAPGTEYEAPDGSRRRKGGGAVTGPGGFPSGQ